MAIAAVAVAGVVAGLRLVVAGGTYQPPLSPGCPTWAPWSAGALPILRTLTDIAAVVTIGWLLAATVLDPSGKDGVVSRVGRRDLVRATWFAAHWAVLALVQMRLRAGATCSAMPLSRGHQPGQYHDLRKRAPDHARAVRSWRSWPSSWPSAPSHLDDGRRRGLAHHRRGGGDPARLGRAQPGLGDHALATTCGVAHVVAAVVWMGGLLALAVHALRRDCR